MEIHDVMLLFIAAVLTTTTASTMPFRDQCLYWHNYFRTLHQAPPVTWSMELQKEAEDWVKYLAENDKFQHSTKNPGNLYLADYRPKEYCTDAVQWFHSEEKDYNYSNPKYYKAAGHFTQVIWKNSRQIGAAWAIRKDKRLVISIKYKPGGNVVNYFGRNVLPPTAALLGPEWTRVPPKFTRCPSLISTTSKEVGTEEVGTTEVGTMSDIFAASERTVSNIVNFTGSLVLAMLIS